MPEVVEAEVPDTGSAACGVEGSLHIEEAFPPGIGEGGIVKLTVRAADQRR
jgi:hypothetical protein